MAKIKRILGWENRDDHAIVYVRLEDGTDAEAYVGGSVEVFHHAGPDKVKVFVKRSADKPIQKGKDD